MLACHYFHPECIGLHAGPAVLQAMPSFKCIECEKSGRTSPLYNQEISIMEVLVMVIIYDINQHRHKLSCFSM